jgi:hypothetical protein
MDRMKSLIESLDSTKDEFVKRLQAINQEKLSAE